MREILNGGQGRSAASQNIRKLLRELAGSVASFGGPSWRHQQALRMEIWGRIFRALQVVPKQPTDEADRLVRSQLPPEGARYCCCGLCETSGILNVEFQAFVDSGLVHCGHSDATRGSRGEVLDAGRWTLAPDQEGRVVPVVVASKPSEASERGKGSCGEVDMHRDLTGLGRGGGDDCSA